MASENNPLREKYSYDSNDQLVRHDSATQGASWIYSYDHGGNILSKKRYAYTTGNLGAVQETIDYKYQSGMWGDLLIEYGDKELEYDEIGNLTEYDGNSFSWEGRRLSGISGNGKTISYTYNADGIRTEKTVNGTKA